jgi:hypothetical protein
MKGDINDTMRSEGAAGVRARHDKGRFSCRFTVNRDYETGKTLCLRRPGVLAGGKCL